MSEPILEAIYSIQTIYVVMMSDNNFLHPIFQDAELYEIEMIYNEFFNINGNMRETNILKTSYSFKKLFKKCESNFNNFIKRHPKIKNKFSKIDPDSGMEYLEF
jgi:hypothetical protein